MTDEILLQQYIQEHSQQAFADLVYRHTDWVYSAAVRLVRDPHLAEDVTQAVFILLAQKASKLGRKPINAWLFRVLRFTASHALRAQARRQRLETQAAAMIPKTTNDNIEHIWEQSAPLLEDAVRQLGASDRQVILLRFYQQKSMAQVGEALGVSKDAAKKRVARAVQKLRSKMAGKGQTIPSLALAETLSAKTTSVAPPTLASTCASLSSTNASALALAKGSSLMMLTFNLKIAATLIVFAGLTSGAIALVLHDVDAPQSPVPTPLAATIPTTAPAPSVSSIVPNLKLTLAWNRQNFDVPPPALIPDAMRQTAAYKRWTQIGDAETLQWLDADNTKYVANAIGNVLLDGNRLQLIASISKYRPDGTLAVRTTPCGGSEGFGLPEEWSIYAANGVTRLFYVHNRVNGLPGTPFIEDVDIRHADGSATQYHANRYGVVVYEWLLDAGWTSPVKLLNGGHKYENLKPEDLK